MFVPKKISMLMDRLLPRSFIAALHKIYDPYYSWQLQRISTRLVGKIFPAGELKVIGGPFKGMRYIPSSRGSVLVPKLLGSYEAEIHPALEECFTRDYKTIVNIGCAEGYYLVGCAIRMPGAHINGYDTDPSATEKCKALAALNSVDSKRISIKGTCTTDDLRRFLPEKCLIISDCEGAETFLFDPEAVPQLNTCDFVIELHDREAPGATELLRRRFGQSHQIQILERRPRNPADYPILNNLTEADKAQAVDEFRSDQARWGVFISKTSKR